jgi:FkbM family methyltransferase
VKYPTDPYLSLVVATRNDDHGGNLMGRTQIFLDGWLTQARRYNISSELIFVEWNPPVDRPPLAEALKWPADLGPCTVRFIEVPAELHQRYQHAAGLPLYQMIGKNVGIRRARGRFVLATNIDILFSDELAAFLGERRLETNRMYRVDRYDAMSDVPAGASLDEQLAYCRTHLIRVNRREGTFEVTPDGGPALSGVDIASPESGILLGQGWFTPERLGPMEPFRWAQEKAEVLLAKTPEPGSALVVDLEPGPGSLGKPVTLEVTTDDGQVLARLTLDDRSRLHLQLPSPRPNRLWFRAEGEFFPVNFGTQTLCFRAFRVAWESGQPSVPATLDKAPLSNRILSLWRKFQYVIGKLADGGPLVSLTVPVSPRLRRILRFYVDRGGLTGMLLHPGRPPAARAEASTGDTVGPEPSTHAPPLSADCLHTNASGDFQLAAREHWFDLRGYPEFDMYSMNLDSVFCFAAQYAGAREEFLADPMRIYHIEHGSGSGWTPEGQKSLYARLAAKGIPVLDNEEVLHWGAQMRRLNSPMIFNHEDWGLGELDLAEAAPGPEPTTGIALDAAVIPSLRALVPALRAYTEVPQSGPEIESGLLSAARTLAYTRPLTPYPGWIFGSDWDKPDIECRMRRYIWTYFRDRNLDAPFQMNWHKGLTVQIYLGNDASLPLFIGGSVEPNEFAFLDSVLKEGMVFVDAGANEGLYSLFASRCVGPSGRVFAFEPSQRELDRLTCNIRLNGLENVRAVRAALSDVEGELELHIACSEHSGHNTLGTFAHEVPLLRTERVSARTLDAFAAEAGLTRLDFLKLDVEGAERRVLDGSRKVLHQMRPMILLEASDATLSGQGSSVSDVLEFLRLQDYRVYAFSDSTGAPTPAQGETRSGNLIAVPMEKSEIKSPECVEFKPEAQCPHVR